MNSSARLPLLAALLSLSAAACAPGPRGAAPAAAPAPKGAAVPIMVDNERDWKREELGTFAVYRIGMTGAPPRVKVIVPDEAAKAAFSSLYPPQTLSALGREAEASVLTLAEYEKSLSETDAAERENRLVRVVTELKTHSAVVFDYSGPR
jgi:hypothetical protein